jgi:hypothetical protein
MSPQEKDRIHLRRQNRFFLVLALIYIFAMGWHWIWFS